VLKNSKNWIPRELKLARKNKDEELRTAHLKVRPFKATQNRVFRQSRLPKSDSFGATKEAAEKLV